MPTFGAELQVLRAKATHLSEAVSKPPQNVSTGRNVPSAWRQSLWGSLRNR
jgi:hypothetical protein